MKFVILKLVPAVGPLAAKPQLVGLIFSTTGKCLGIVDDVRVTTFDPIHFRELAERLVGLIETLRHHKTDCGMLIEASGQQYSLINDDGQDVPTTMMLFFRNYCFKDYESFEQVRLPMTEHERRIVHLRLNPYFTLFS